MRKAVTAESGERTAVTKQLAMIFADFAGTTALAAQVGDLVVAGVLQEFFQCSYRLQTIHHGRVLKTFGDGFLAIFEDVAHALHFATALQRSLGQEPMLAGQHLAAHISLHVGAVVLMETSYGEDVFGAEVNMGAALERYAQPGEIVVSEAACQALPSAQQALLGPSERVTLKQGEVAFRRLAVVEG
jgi:adenylate cyclase